jgi:hypothetical protein
MHHVWYYWETEGYALRRCLTCDIVEALGPGGWTEVP